jgi:molybdopterin synthase catalytic subunit
MMFELTESTIAPKPVDDPSVGAAVVFTGLVRDHNDGRSVTALDYEAMPVVAEKEGIRILEEAKKLFGATNLHCVHRIGALKIGDIAVQVTATAGHRGAAFAACQWVIDEVKKRVPIWKREHYADGTIEWVNAAESAVQEGPAVLVESAEALSEWRIIDVRDEDELAEEPLEGFPHEWSPSGAFDRALLAEGRALLVCASGIRALILADDLRREGYTDVWSLTGGCKTLKALARKSAV